MTGKELFDRYQLAALAKGLGSQEFSYGNLLYQALRLEGEDKLFKMLEVAEKTGKRIALSHSCTTTGNPPDYPDPDIAILI